MSFADHKIQTFTKKITALADQHNMQPDELKAYFDSSPEELRQAHNSLCDALTAPTAAANIGFAQTAGVPAGTVQAAIENVQSQVTAAIIGSIPSGSIDGDKLAQDVRDRLTAIETAAANETNTRAGADTNLQNQINTHTAQLSSLTSGKCEIYCGTYTGNGAAQQDIYLGFAPKAVFILYNGTQTGSYEICGGLAIAGSPLIINNQNCIVPSATGFSVYQNTYVTTNMKNGLFYYLAFKQI